EVPPSRDLPGEARGRGPPHDQKGGAMLSRIFTLMTVVILAPSVNTTAAHAAGHLDRARECRYQSADGHPGWSPWEVQQTIRCAAGKFGVSATTAFYVANRESHDGQFS